MEGIIFHYFSLAVKERFDMHLMNVVVAYLYKLLDANINVKFSNGLKILNINENKTRKIYNIKLQM